MDEFRRFHWYFLNSHEHFHRSQALNPYHIGRTCTTCVAVAFHGRACSSIFFVIVLFHMDEKKRVYREANRNDNILIMQVKNRSGRLIGK